MQKIISLMQSVGFTQYESQVYLALLKQSNVTGYELAKLSGVPASKIYPILNRLLDKEIVQVIDTEPKKYIPQPPDEILSRMRTDYSTAFDVLDEKLEHIYSEEASAGNHIWNVSGREIIIRKVIDFINECEEKLYLSVWDEELDEIADSLRSAKDRGVQITIVHFGEKLLGIENEYKHGREHSIRIERGGRRIALIVDDKKVILGHFSEDGSSNAAWTVNKGLVLLAKDYIIHDIYSIRIVQKYGDDALSIFDKV
ncbi:MAG: helix-turn-helix domain-containing protein [Calditrichaceae bacterium]|jgi:HTH-type transcriptional regulator, sugar sensing transcriptional regulator